jgi:hypothetical protein
MGLWMPPPVGGEAGGEAMRLWQRRGRQHGCVCAQAWRAVRVAWGGRVLQVRNRGSRRVRVAVVGGLHVDVVLRNTGCGRCL